MYIQITWRAFQNVDSHVVCQSGSETLHLKTGLHGEVSTGGLQVTL